MPLAASLGFHDAAAQPTNEPGGAEASAHQILGKPRGRAEFAPLPSWRRTPGEEHLDAAPAIADGLREPSDPLPLPPLPPPAPPSPTAATDRPEVLARFHSQLDLVDLNARQVARRMGFASITLDDLRSFGREGLLTAARSFDDSLGVPFRRWANLRIRGAILDGVRKWGGIPRRVYRELRDMARGDGLQGAYDEETAGSPGLTPEAADTRLTSYLAGLATAMAVGAIATSMEDGGEVTTPGPSPEDVAEQRELMDRVKAAIATLPESERTLVMRHYFAEETLDEAAASLGLSKSWGSRLHARAIDAIARELRSERTPK